MNNKKFYNFYAIAFLLLLVYIATYTIFPRISTHIVGDGGDAPIFAWNLWWVKYSLFNLHQSPLSTDYLFYPTGSSLVFHTLTLVNGLMSIPLQAFFSLTVVHNLVFIMNLVLCAVSSYFLAKRFGLKEFGSIISALIFTISPVVFGQAIGHMNITTVWFLPASLLFFSLALEEKRFLYSILTTAVVALAIYNDFYIATYVFIINFFYLIFYVISKRPSVRKIATRIALIIFALALLCAPLIHIIRDLPRNAQLPQTSQSEYAMWGADIARLFLPSAQNPLSRYIHTDVRTNEFGGIEDVLFIGYLTSLLMIIAIVIISLRGSAKKDSKIVFSIVSFAVFILLALGPTVFFMGKPIMIGSHNLGVLFALFSKIPVVNGLRCASRFVVPAMLFMGIGCGFVVDEFSNWLNKKDFKLGKITFAVFFIFVSILILFEFNAQPIWMEPTKLPKFYELIGKDKSDVAVLNMPFRMKTGRSGSAGEGFSMQQFSQSIHHKRMVDGYISYTSPDTADAAKSNKDIWDFTQNCRPDLDINKINDFLVAKRVKYIIISQQDYASGKWFSFGEEKYQSIKKCVTRLINNEVIFEDNQNTVLLVK